jgi:membrane-associated phospholipid phosphatase
MSILELGIQLNLWLQGLGEWLLAPMQFFSFLGNEEFFLIVAPALYWCVDAGLGLRMGLFLMVSGGVNQIIKLALHAPRPYWVNSSVRAYTAEGSFGIPSGHSQNAFAVWGVIAAHVNRRRIWVAALSIIFLIGLSRIYMGVHFPSDVLAGWLVGALLLWGMLIASSKIEVWVNNHTTLQALLAALGGAMGIIFTGAMFRMALSGWSLPAEWVENARAALPDAATINPLALSGLITNGGTFFGLAAGALMLRNRGGFNASGAAWKRVIRYFVGVAGVLILYLGLGSIFPRGESLLPYVLRFIRYSLVGFWVTGLAPLVFHAFHLADRGNLQD